MGPYERQSLRRSCDGWQRRDFGGEVGAGDGVVAGQDRRIHGCHWRKVVGDGEKVVVEKMVLSSDVEGGDSESEEGSGGSVDKVRLPHSPLANLHFMLPFFCGGRDFYVRGPLFVN